jgi:light-regulated signal transduction histidine kinase (bacteriophytochrome)
MGLLIDDLLTFSRVGRSEMRISHINMVSMVHSLYQEVVTEEVRGKISFTMDSLPEAWGDTSLMRQVWFNLLSNAVKFSSRNEHISLEVGSRKEEEETVYGVKDNGVGFDMHYVHKLYGVFQRLHGSTEFEGTGVGLALVQRIIKRHGGRVWAEGEVGKGATFSFALPAKSKAEQEVRHG